MYSENLKWWITHSRIPLFAVDSFSESNRLPDEDFLKKHMHFHHFTQPPTINGRPPNSSSGELLSVEKAFNFFDFRDFDVIFKVTGKYIVPGIDKHLLNLPRADLYLQSFILHERELQFSEIFGMTRQLWPDYIRYATQEQAKDANNVVEYSLYHFSQPKEVYELPRLDVPISSLVKRGNGDHLTRLSGGKFEDSLRDGPITFRTPISDAVVLTAGIGGGSNEFIERLLQHYKGITVVRSIQNSNRVLFTQWIGGHREMTAQEALKELKGMLFYKMFVNHTLFFPQSFLRECLEMKNKCITTISHDMNWIASRPISIDIDGNKVLSPYRKRIHLLCQSKAIMNVYRYNTQKDPFKSVRFVTMPDYTGRLDEPIDVDSEKPKLMALGAVSPIKGSDEIHRLHALYPNDVCLIGIIAPPTDGSISKLQPNGYDTNNFNAKLKESRPNVCIMPNKVCETWSYTLTLCILAGIPVILKKLDFDNAPRERLLAKGALYEHDYEDFDSLLKLADEIKVKTIYPVDFNSYKIPSAWDEVMQP